MILRTIIVEDEPLSRLFLDNLLSEFCEEVNVIARATSEDEAVSLIEEMQPDLVFLDIELQQGGGFGVLQRINCSNTHIIFTTAYDHHAITSIRFSGSRYISKPIDLESLRSAIKNITDDANAAHERKAIGHLLETLNNDNRPLHLAIFMSGAYEYVRVTDIIRIEAVERGCCFFLKNNTVVKGDLELKEYEKLLCDHDFFRTQVQHLVNVAAIKKIEGENIFMADGSIVPLSTKRSEELVTKLNMRR